jgi:hypothetical protein
VATFILWLEVGQSDASVLLHKVGSFRKSYCMKGLGVEFQHAFPKWESLKNKSGKSGVFFEPEK